MKIDFLISSLSGGGAERVMVILANHFVTRGHKVSIISFNEGDVYELDSGIERIKLHNGRFKNQRLRCFDSLRRHYNKRKNRPDVLISFITLTNLIAVTVAKLYGIKVIISEHNSHLQAQYPKFLTRFTRNFFYPRADYLTVLTAFDVEFYEKKGANVVVMPNPCTFAPISQNEHDRDKTILAVGNLDRYNHKGFDNLLHIIKPVLEKNPEWNLKIIGGGEKGESFLKSLAKDLNIERRVIFTGFQNNVKEHMRNASIFILSSRYEGLPMVLLEAMSQGMVCIAYDCKTGPADLLSDGISGLLIPDQNIEVMKQGLTRLINDKHLRKKLSQNAMESLNEFSIEAIAIKWEILFEKLKA
jgi:glycosyltransferase involved in cell wall biosynthesis